MILPATNTLRPPVGSAGMRATRLCVFALALAGCIGPSAPKAAPPKAASWSLTEQTAFAERVQADEAQRVSVGGEGTLSLSQRGLPFRGAITVAAADSGRLRLDVSDDVGRVVFVLSNDGDTVTLLDLVGHKAQKRPVAEATLANLGLSDWPVSALSALLLAQLPCRKVAPRVVSATEIEVAPCGGGTVLASYSTKATLYLTELRLNVRGSVVRAKLYAHTHDGFPRRLEVETDKGSVKISLKELDPNPTFPIELFRPEIPPGLAP